MTAYARKLEELGRVHDGSDPAKRIVPGYMLFEAYVRVGKWQLFPLLLDPLKTYAGAPTSENAEISAHVLRVHEATGGKGTWLLDRGFDRDELMLLWLKKQVAFVIRQRGDRHVLLADGRKLAITALADELKPLGRWPPGRATRLSISVLYRDRSLSGRVDLPGFLPARSHPWESPSSQPSRSPA